MKINTRIRYGLRTMIEIAKSPQNEGILQTDIAKNQEISFKYLDSIISSLKVKGLIFNVKGKGSGYKLTRDASEISLYDIYTSFEQIVISDCIQNDAYCQFACNCTAKDVWYDVRNEFVETLKSKSLATIIQ